MFSPINEKSQKTFGKQVLLLSGLIFFGTTLQAQTTDPIKEVSSPDSAKTIIKTDVALSPKKEQQWYQKISLRGYTQIRYNRLLETNPNLKTDYDKSVGDNGGFLIRRARLVFSGNVHDRVYIYIQPDLASTPSSSTNAVHFAQLRDAYFDLALDKKKEFRLRFGQSKVPYGFENMQSSQNRLTLDRSDALNTTVPNERDLGVMFYWAPEKVREQFSEQTNRTLKGSGDYGLFALGVYNGQTANRNEGNDNLHVVARVTYPLVLKNGQIIEPGIQAHTGVYNVGSDQLSSTAVKGGNFRDNRVAGTLVVYPQPLGFQTEYNIGKGPEFDPETKTIQTKSLHGGYAQVMYNLKAGNHTLFPFLKMQYYKGGRKVELDARASEVYETEIGVEWQPFPAFELVADYAIMDRTTRDNRNLNNRQFGNLLRLQAQFNF